MGVWEIVVGAVVLVLSIIMIILIILQEGHQAGLGAVTGGADSFLSRGKARTADALFARITKYCAVLFFILVIVLNAIAFFGGSNKETGTDAAVSSDTSATETSKEESKQESKEESKEESKAETSKEESKAESASSSSEG